MQKGCLGRNTNITNSTDILTSLHIKLIVNYLCAITISMHWKAETGHEQPEAFLMMENCIKKGVSIFI